MWRCPEATQKVGDQRCNFPHSFHGVCSDHGNNRCVGICSIPGAFLSADIDKDVKMSLCGRLVEMVVNIAPQIYIYTARDIREFQAGPLRNPKEVALWMSLIGIAVI